MTSDADRVRAEQREIWEQSAADWATAMEPFYEAAQPVSDRLIALADPRPGDRVLELACGRGDLSIEVARRVQPDGHVICSDGAEAMVEVAAARIAEAGLPEDLVTVRPIELEWVDQDAASLDAIVCRFGYMLTVDPEAAFREARRTLRPGGRLAFSVWAAAAENEWLSAVGLEAIAAGLIDRPDPGTPGPFSLADTERLTELLASAGFIAPELDFVDICFAAGSVEEYWDFAERTSNTMRTILSGLSPADHYRLRDAVESRWQRHGMTGGGVSIPGRAICVLAEA